LVSQQNLRILPESRAISLAILHVSKLWGICVDGSPPKKHTQDTLLSLIFMARSFALMVGERLVDRYL
jgi:hypothetical protein